MVQIIFRRLKIGLPAYSIFHFDLGVNQLKGIHYRVNLQS